MKVAVLADIHGNLPALDVVVGHLEAWRPDQVVMAGDVVNRGPRPRECLELVEQRQRGAGWQVVRGNHEDYVLWHDRPDAPRSGPEFDVTRNAYWTYRQLDGRVAALEAMPFQASLHGPDGREVRVVHASMRSNRDGIFPDTSDEELRRQIVPAPAVLCVGHTHRPLVRQIDGTLVVNVGAVGMPFDGDHRAAYAQLTWQKGRWAAEIVRLAYDRARTEQEFFETGFIEEAGELARVMLLELREARSHVYGWAGRYEAAVLAGEMTLAESVQDYLARFAPG